MSHRLLVLGAYGNFGARVCRALAPDPDLELLLAGRNAGRAAELAQRLGAGEPVAIDYRDRSLASRLRGLGVDTVVHTAGPFQRQGYGVALAAAAAGANYIDLADGRRFVCDFARHTHRAFLDAGRAGITGASTLPGLSTAVINHLSSGWRTINAIDICIAPAQSAPRGRATLQAVLDYCGAPIQVWTGGRWNEAIGWGSPRPVAVRGLAPRLGAICDVPDLELLPNAYRVVDRVEFRAALEVRITQHLFALLAALRARRLIPAPARFAGAFDRASTAFDRFGTGRGGMSVSVFGVDGLGRAARSSWHLVADNDHGPEIPCMAAILLARALKRGDGPEAGAHTCVGLLSLADFQPEFHRWGMTTEQVDE